MNIFSVAIGDQYEKEVQRLIRSVLQPVNVFMSSNKKYKKISEDKLIDGLYHKANFANYIDDVEGPIIFMDADMFTLKTNPFEDFKVSDNVDLAYVSYPGKWYLPDEIRKNAYDFHGHKINSGFIWFKNLSTAKNICTKWADELLKRPQHWIKNEYDEWALMIALMNTEYKIEILDEKWNVWELETEEDIKASESIFFQSHNFLDIDIKNK
jgi:hypothetical protein